MARSAANLSTNGRISLCETSRSDGSAGCPSAGTAKTIVAANTAPRNLDWSMARLAQDSAGPMLQAPCAGRRCLKVKPDGRGYRPRRNIMGTAERGKEVVECFFIRQIDDGQAGAPPVLVGVEDV